MTSAQRTREPDALILRKVIDPSMVEYGPLLNDLVQRLARAGVGPRRRNSVKDIVLEYLLNIRLHRRDRRRSSILVRKRNRRVEVTMQGSAGKRDRERMQEIVNKLSGKSSTALWRELDQQTFAEKPFPTKGAGVGLLTVAALSVGKPALVFREGDRAGYFELRSSV